MEAMRRLTQQYDELPAEDSSPQKFDVANDEEIVFSAPAPSVEVANDNEKQYTQPFLQNEIANDNQEISAADQERLQNVIERLGMNKSESVPIQEEKVSTVQETLPNPESEEVLVIESAEKVAGQSKEPSITRIEILLAAAGAGKKKGGGVEITDGESDKKKSKWRWLLKPFKWALMLFGGIFALSMTTINKLTDVAVKQMGGKGGGHAPAKKASSGGGHGGGHGH